MLARSVQRAWVILCMYCGVHVHATNLLTFLFLPVLIFGDITCCLIQESLFRSFDASIYENVDSVQDVFLKHRELTISHVAECLRLSIGTSITLFLKFWVTTRCAHVVCPDC